MNRMPVDDAGLRLHCGPQYGGGLSQAFGVVLRSTAAQRQHGHSALRGAHYLPLTVQQRVDLLTQFGKGGGF